MSRRAERKPSEPIDELRRENARLRDQIARVEAERVRLEQERARLELTGNARRVDGTLRSGATSTTSEKCVPGATT